MLKILRVILWSIFIIVASFGAGLYGIVPSMRNRFRNNEIKIEMIDRERKKEDHEEMEDDKE